MTFFATTEVSDSLVYFYLGWLG